MHKLTSILLVIFCLHSANAEDFVFHQIGLDEGLSQISVLALHQDHQNRIWIGTRDGLNRYDGNNIKTYRSIIGDTTTLISSEIHRIDQMDHNLWILSNTGVSRLNLLNMKIKRYPLPVTHDLCVFERNIYISSTDGVFQYNKATESFTLISELSNPDISYKTLYNNGNKELWVGTEQNGLIIYNLNSKTSTSYFSNDVKNISKIFRDSRHNIWLGTEMDGIALISSNFEIIKKFKSDKTPESLINNHIRDIHQDKTGNIWIGTFRGISVYNPLNKKFTTLTHSNYNENSLSHNSIYCFLEDNNGNLWIGTYFGGLNYTTIRRNIFKRYNSPHPNKHPSYQVIGKFVEDEKNNIWIATEGGGLNYYNRATGNFKYYTANSKPNSLNQNNIKALHLHNKDTMLIGTHTGGLNILDIQNGKIKNFLNDKNKDDIPLIIGDIKPYKDDYLIGSHSGLYRFDIKAEKFSLFFSDSLRINKIGNNIFGILIDSKNNLWVSTEKNGLFRYNLISDKLTHYEAESTSIGSNAILSIYEDHQFRIWIATLGGGLNQYNPKTDNFTTYTRNKNNLPSNYIYGIAESRFGNLWISTINGLARFDVENNKFYVYDHNSGFPLSELNMNSLLLSSKGELFVGGIDGMVSFNETEIIKHQDSTNIIFTTLTVNNTEITPNDKSGILTKDISAINSFVLGPKHNSFKLDFTSCNYDPEFKHKYKYLLEGFDKDWIEATSKSYASYTNISPGNYTLKIRAFDAVYNETLGTKKINIEIHPPFYHTWWAYLVYITFFFTIVLLINYFYREKVRSAFKLRQEQKEKNNQNELNQNKLRFFTNISHEFQTPLTLIIGSLEQLRKTTGLSGKSKKRIDLVYKNASRLKNLTSELLDFRKIDQGYLKIKVQEVNFIEYIDTIYTAFIEIARDRKIDYTFKKINNNIAIWCDPHQMDKVFYNLLSNAFKFVNNKEGQITIEIINYIDTLEIIIADNGRGIPKNDVNQIFDRFYQTENSADKQHTGSGIGLALSKGIIDVHDGEIKVESELEKGTRFIITLKKGNKHFKKSQLRDKINETHITSDYIKTLNEDHIEKNEKVLLPESTPTILVADDNPNIIGLLRDIFEDSYHVIEAKDGNEAFELALEKQPDMIISDIMMPVLSGTEMCRKLKRNFLTSHIPIILLTARTAMEHKIEGIETGAEDYITKPFSTDYLVARVENIFNNLSLLHKKYSQDLSIEHKHITKNKMDQDFIDKATEIIEEHITDPNFSVTDFTDKMGQSRTLFYRKVKAVAGLTPNELVQTIRLKKAAEMLLSNSEKNISEIAYDVGFSSPRYFSQCFKNHFGVIPSKYVIDAENKDKSPG